MNDTPPDAIRAIALIAATLVVLTGGMAHAQTVPATGSTAAPIAGQLSVPEPDAVPVATPWYLEGRLLVGVSWGSVVTIDKNLGTQYKVAPFVRWNSRRRGWGPSFGFSFTTMDLRVPLEGKAEVIGSVKIRPVMGGIGYSIVKGRTRTTFGLVGGYAFNDAKVSRALPDGVGVDVTIQNAWVAQPKVDVMFAATRRIALITSIGYSFTSPDVSATVTRNGQQTFRTSDHVRADSFSVRLGAAVSLF
jgi:hypothetical protein